MWRNPVMFVVEIVTVLTTVLLVHDLATGRRTWLRYPDQSLAVVYIAVREFCRGGGRGARQGAGRQSAADRTETLGKRLLPDVRGDARTGLYQPIPAPELAVGDVVLVEAGDHIPATAR
jgi:K+-transporting ATPase ATPase B chain